MAISMSYPIRHFTTLLRIRGVGNRAISTFPHRRTPMIDRVLKMFKKRELPLELWLGRGRPLNPYLKGCLMDFLRGKAAPLDLKLYPQEALIGPRMAERLEKTVFASWMKQWLKYLKWYHGMEP